MTKKLSLANWILSIFKIIFFIIAIFLVVYSAKDSNSWSASKQIAIASITGISWLIFITTNIATITMNIIISIKSNPSLTNDHKIISILLWNRKLAIISIFVLNIILNFLIFIKTKNQF